MRGLLRWVTKWLMRLALVCVALIAAAVGLVFLNHDLSRETALIRARAPELTARFDTARNRTFGYFADHPYDADGEIGMWVDYEDIPQSLKDAVVLREDRHFFEW